MKTVTKEEALKRIEEAGLEEEVREIMELNLDVIFDDTDSKEPARMDVETELGTVTAYENTESECKGIYLCFTPKGQDTSCEIDLMSAEVPESGDLVSLKMWSDPFTEDMTEERNITYADITEALGISDM